MDDICCFMVTPELMQEQPPTGKSACLASSRDIISVCLVIKARTEEP